MNAPDGLAALKINRTQRRNRRSIWPWLLLVIVGAGIYLSPKVMKSFQVPEVSVTPAVKVRAADGAEGKPIGTELTAAGYVVADRQSTLAAKVTGRLIKMNVAEADHVKQGFVVAEVDHRELDAGIAQVQAEKNEVVAEVERMKKMLAQSEAELSWQQTPLATIDAEMREIDILIADAKRRYERDKAVAERNALPSFNVEDRFTEIKVAEAKMAVARFRKAEAEKRVSMMDSQVSVAKTAIGVTEARSKSVDSKLKVLETQLLDYYVIAPFDGVITEKVAELGEIVAPISVGGTMAKGSVATLVDWATLQAEVDVAETQIGNVKAGARAAITVDAIPGKVFPGKVRRILPRANRSKATVQVRVDFIQRDDTVLPEMGVRVKFIPDDAPAGTETGAVKEKIFVPKSAVQTANGNTFVWVIGDNAAKKKTVTVGDATGASVEIKTGLTAGEKVVTKGAEKLTEENQKVKVE
jgi:RND family efflux transporter MFP subunit